MPLGVEEFLNHVHLMDKGKKLTPGLPFSEYSIKSHLVTNAEIEDLLDNDDTFIYGRNPNKVPVPIYGVVTLCNNETKQHQRPATVVEESLPAKINQNKQKQASTINSTRAPYIPVSIDSLDDRNAIIRRSSRLYPVFYQAQRDAVRNRTASENKVDLSQLRAQIPFVPISKYDLINGETHSRILSENASLSLNNTHGETVMDKLSNNSSTGGQASNFIANLADNVRFTGIDDIELDETNTINTYFIPALDVTNKSEQHKVQSFHVTYWMFYPYSQGKTMCTLSLGPLGSIPFPALYGFCLGTRKAIGSHVGDWEHMSLYFNGGTEPEAMYVSAHDAGAYYSYNRLTGSFEFTRQETRKGILQRPNFPKTVTTFNDHPVLFAAKGSHGLWTAPGKHSFVKVARLYDINGFGTPWNTWNAVDISYDNLNFGSSLVPNWLTFKGKWGNPKSKCHPFKRIGLNFCEYTDGPTGIPLKEPHFLCGTSYR